MNKLQSINIFLLILLITKEINKKRVKAIRPRRTMADYLFVEKMFNC